VEHLSPEVLFCSKMRKETDGEPADAGGICCIIPVRCSCTSDFVEMTEVISSCLSTDTESAFKSNFDSSEVGTFTLISPAIEQINISR